jgi:hypothetical protein
MGRSRISPEKRKRFLEAKAKGATNNLCCAAAGFGIATLYRWLAKGQAPDSRAVYRKFYLAYQRAEAKACEEALDAIKTFFEADWKAAAWFLERTRPHDYSLQAARFAKEERERLEALGREQDDQPTPQTVEALLLDLVTRLSPDAARELLDVVRATKAEDDDDDA